MYFQRIKELREDKDLKQINVADFLEMKQPQYQRYESGRRDFPIDILIKLAKFYNTSLDYIVELTDEIKPYTRKK